jgi:hypothetical protein
MKKYIWIAVLLLPGIVFAADGVQMTPGKWEMTMTMEMSMMNNPQTKTEEVCIEDEEFTPEDFNMEQDTPCDLSDIEVDGDTMRWSVNCPAPNGSMTGSWEFTSQGDTVEGSGEMSAQMGGMSMDMDMSWTGAHVGDCD